MNELRWGDLRTFLAVARRGTLASAAVDLGINPSTAHRHIAVLEEALSGRLFERAPRGYALTHLGEALLPHAREVEEAVLGLQRAAQGHDRSATGPVILTLPETLLDVVLPCLAAVHAVCPGLQPILRTDDRMLDLGVEADVALRPSAHPPEEAVGRKVGTVAWCRYRHREATDDAPWVLYAEGTGPVSATAWRRRRFAEVRPLLTVASVGAMQRVLGPSRARGLLPCYLGDPDSDLVRECPPIPEAATDLWLLIHADLRRSARVRALVDLLLPRLRATAPLLAGETGTTPLESP